MVSKKSKRVRWILLIGWMAFIFFMSSQNGDQSSEQSALVVQIFTWLGIDLNSYFGDLATFIIRKGAHVSEYFILFILTYRVVLIYVDRKKAKLYSLVVVFLYACSDEIHQYFVPGRGPAFKDVLIDTSGGVIAGISSIVYEKFGINLRKDTK